MKVRFVRTGGVAGMRLAVTLDSETLSAREAARLKRLIGRAASIEASPPATGPRPGADRFQYRLTVEEGGRTRRLELDDASVPPALRPLLDYLAGRARAPRAARRRSGGP
jgi:hypothetical protein